MINDLESFLMALGESVLGFQHKVESIIVPFAIALDNAIWDAMPQWMHDENARLQAEKLEIVKRKADDANLANYLSQFSGVDDDE